jgi:hypothetical protein
MKVSFLKPNKLKVIQDALNGDSEFKLAAKGMSETIELKAKKSRCLIGISDGVVSDIRIGEEESEKVSFSIDATFDSWELLLKRVPPPFYTGIFAGMLRGKLQISGNLERAFVYLWAINRIFDILRYI